MRNICSFNKSQNIDGKTASQQATTTTRQQQQNNQSHWALKGSECGKYVMCGKHAQLTATLHLPADCLSAARPSM